MKNNYYNINKGISRLTALLLSVIILALSVTTAFADENKTVKIGVFSLGQFQSLSEKDGKTVAQGYNADYLNQIGKKTHWNYEYVPCENWVDATAKLEKGEIDLLAPAQITDDLKKQFDYSALYLGTESAAIYANADCKVDYGDYESMQNLTFGCVKVSTFTNEFLGSYSKKNNLAPKYKTYENTTELMSALENKEVDAIVTNIMFANDNYKMLDWFLVLPVYYITQKGNTELLAELDNAMRSLTVEDPDLLGDLAQKYFPIYSSTKLTPDEKEYISILPTINVGYEQSQAPLSYTDKNNEFAGISRKFMDNISKFSGIKFNFVPLPSGKITWDYLKENEIYLLCSVEYNEQNLAIPQMSLSTPYLETEKVLISNDDTDITSNSTEKIGIVSGDGSIESAIKNNYPNYEISQYDTNEMCLDEIISKHIDGAMLNRYVAEILLENPLYSDLSVIPAQALNDRLSVCVNNFGNNTTTETLVNDAKLISIIDKAINNITTNEKNNYIITSSSDARYKQTLGDFINTYPAQITIALAAVFLIIVLFVLLLLIRQRSSTQLEATNKQLEKAIIKADRANGAKSQFLAQMSHEIRTPMNAIIGLTTIAKTEAGNEKKTTEYLNKIDSSSKLLLSIINDVLDMSAIEGGKLKIDNAPFNLKKTISNLTTVFYQQAKQKDVNFEVRMEGVTEENVIGDQLRVNQILMNLLSNAVKFTPSGGEVDLMIIQASHSGEKVQMRFSVSDTGCGMSKDMLERLFKPFEQESASTARKHGGSGLGLSITKNLTELMGGSIKVESVVDKGSVFTVDLPFGSVEDNTFVDKTTFNKVRSLIVDDDKESCEYCGILFERLGVRYDYVTSGEAALEALGEAEDKNDPYKLCLVDWKMPDMNGVEVTQKIREIFGNDAIIIIVSAYDLNEIESEGRRAGANYFVPKPLFQSTLFNALMRISGGEYTKVLPEDEIKKYNFENKRVLVAEDVTLNMEVAIKLLDMVNITATCAEDGRQAVEIFKKSEIGYYDCILMDINMPVMDGYEATKEIRKLNREDAKNVPIFAMTANAFSEDVTAALDAGMNGHIAKPIETDVLYETLQDAFEEK